MCFQSEEEAYQFYNSYAKSKGFSIRKCHNKKRADGTVSSKYLVCSKEGVKAKHPTHETVKEQAISRVNCSARVHFNISRDGIWNIQKVVLCHNHHLVTPDKVHMLRSQRKLVDADRHMIKQMKTSGIRPTEIYNFYEQWYGGAENVPFLEMDSNNFIRSEREKYLESKDAQTLLEYLKNKQAEDPLFFHDVQLDEEEGRIKNFFWADGQAIMDYAVYGDVISFDTTFQTNKFEMPFAPILGVNNHKQTIIFGAALIYDEKKESFEWLFRTFLQAMSGKHPETIFTDQCAAIINAIGKVFPNTMHRLCLWHLYQNAAKHLSHVISNHPEFLKKFKRCVYEERSVAHFETRWQELLVNYKLEGNSWMANLYKLREKWATVHRRDSFSGDMTTTQRSEGMNNAFKKTFRKKLSLSQNY
jgi:zinc finger SWIM domain-containing protein 3